MTTRSGSAGAAGRSRRDRLPVWAETILLLVLALVVSALVKTFLVQMFFVPSGSMRPLFVDNDRILVQKISYWGGGHVQRGDVVVFDDPNGQWLGSEGAPHLTPFQKALSEVGLYPTGGHLVKRVIGVGGDRVACCDRQGRVTVNGVPLNEKSYLPKGAKPSERQFDVKVPKGRLWVMGDNRPNSEDSRFHQDLPGHGTVPEDDVVGKVWAIVWPFGRAHVIREPKTFESARLQHSHG
jgi:signal peptidase I